MHFSKEGQKIRAWVDPPLIWAMPERKRFFSIDVFPKSLCTTRYKCVHPVVSNIEILNTKTPQKVDCERRKFSHRYQHIQ